MGCDLYLMSSVPDNLEKYENSYIWVKGELSYITPDTKVQRVKINDMGKFLKHLEQLPGINTNKGKRSMSHGSNYESNCETKSPR